MIHIQRQSGFTLLELEVVVAIIGVLAVAALPTYQVYVQRAKLAEGFALAPAVEKAVADYYSYTGRLPENNKIAGLPEPQQLRSKYLASITIEQGAIQLRFNFQFDHGDTISLRPAVSAVYPPNAALIWRCGHPAIANKQLVVFGQDKTNIPMKYLPFVCY